MTHESYGSEGSTENGIGRRQFVQGCGALFAVALTGVETVVAGHENDDFESVADLLDEMPDNWGRWGNDDGLGALNLLGSEEMFEGMNAATKSGKERVQRFTLQTPITGFAIDELVGEAPDEDDTTVDTGDPAFPGRFPARRDNWADASDDTEELTTPGGMAFADDAFVSPLYLQGATHCDALGHGWYGENIYNGFDLETTHTPREFDFGVLGIQDLKGDTPSVGDITTTYGLGEADISYAAESGIAGRGVLLDVGRHKGGSDCRLPLDIEDPEAAAVTLEDLTDTADAQGVELRKRDIVLVRTGSIERARDPEAAWNPLHEPGLTYSDALVEWVHEMDIPYLGADNLAVEKVFQIVTEDDLHDDRSDLHGDYALPLHGAFLRDLGVTLNEVLDLSRLAAQCADDGIYEFLFTAAPLHAEMGSGAPVNPVVLKAT